MAHNTAIGIGQQIDPDQLTRIEISRNASAESVEVRVFSTTSDEPYSFEFESMGEAIAFYERLWSSRRVRDDTDEISKIV